MTQRKSLTSLAARASRRSRSGGSSPHNRSSFTDSSVSSQESDSPSEYITPSASRPITPPTRLPTPSVKSKKGRRYTASSKYRSFYNTGSNISSSDDEAGPSENRRDDQDKGKARQIYGDTDSLRLSRMEDKLDELLSLEKQPSHEKKLETATEEHIRSSQSYLNLKDDNARLRGELEAIRTELADSQQAQIQTQSSMQDLEAAMERSENEVSERMAQSMNEYETLQAAYIWAKKNRNGAAEESIKAWDKAKEYERENTILKQKISDLEDVNKELAGEIKAYDLENIKRKELQTDGSSQTEPEAAPKIMESQGTEVSFIDWDPNIMGEMELLGQGESESTGIQDGEQVQQDNRQEDQQEAPHNEPDVHSEEPHEGQQENPQQQVTQARLHDESYNQPSGHQEEPQEELRDNQEEVQQDDTTENLHSDLQESEEDISHDEKVLCGEEQRERLMSTTQETTAGGHIEPETPEQQDMVGIVIENDQPTVESPVQQERPIQQIRPETQDVVLIGIAPRPATAEPVAEPDPTGVSFTDSLRDRNRHRHGKHRHKRKEAGDHHRDRDERHHHRPSHRNDRPSNQEQRIQRRQPETPITYWIRSPSCMKRYFGTGLRELIRSLKIRIRA